MLPVNKDIRYLNSYLHTSRTTRSCITRLYRTRSQYKDLAHLTLASIILHNRRRPNELESLTIEDYEESSHSSYEYNKRRNKTYVFPRTRDDAETPYRASTVLRDLADEAKLQMPENMRCTKLRKHLETMTQLINLQE